MPEIAIETSIFTQILAGEKTIEVLLGKPVYLKLRIGDTIALHEDDTVGQDSNPEMHLQAHVKITQLLYFESLDEMLGTIDFTLALPKVESRVDALLAYRELFSKEDEYEYGVIAMTFELV